MTQSLRVQLNASSEVGAVCDPFECKGERETIWEKGGLATQHLDERVKGMERCLRVSESSNEGVVHESVRVGEV